MMRPIALLAAALKIAAPGFEPREEAALVLQRIGSSLGVDPLLEIAYVESESRWFTNAEHRTAADLYIGLGQIRLRNYADCRESLAAPACADQAARLRGWRYNLEQTAQAFVFARHYCEDRQRSGRAALWLQLVKGWDAARNAHCGHRGGRALPIPKAVSRLLARAETLRGLAEKQLLSEKDQKSAAEG